MTFVTNFNWPFGPQLAFSIYEWDITQYKLKNKASFYKK